MKTRNLVRSRAVGLALLATCGCDSAPKLPPLRPDHQELIRGQNDRHIRKRLRLASPSKFRFAAPVPDRVALWHWEPHVDGKSHSFGYHRGWCVDFWFTPDYEGYPKQPESYRMAFFAEGELRGIFCEGQRNAPLELDKWDAIWVDPQWGQRPPTGAAPR